MGRKRDPDDAGSTADEPRKRETPHQERGSGEAAEGIRTLDLLHGKQTL
jgi:hypothetical protein